MLTVAEALRMPAFAAAQVVAGEKGLTNRIQWVNTIDTPQMTTPHRAGELLFTIVSYLKDQSNSQANLISTLVAQGVAGMVVVVEYPSDDIPASITQQANELGFPIIALPKVPLVRVTQAVSDRILSERYALMQRSQQIHSTLTQLVLIGDDLESLAEALNALVHCPVTIEDASFRLLAHAAGNTANSASQERMEQGRTPRALLIELGKRGILLQLRRDRRPIHIPPLPEQGLFNECIVAPIVAGQELYGYVWVIVRNRTANELDMIAIEHAATVAALILLKEKAVYETEHRLKSALLDELLTGDTGLQRTLVAKARRFKHDLTQSQQILLLRQRDQALLTGLIPWLEGRLRQWKVRGLTVQRAQHLVLLLPSERTEDGEALAQRLWNQGQADGYELLIGIGRAYAGWDKLSESYREAQEALEVGPPLMGRAVVSFNALGMLHWLRHLSPDVREKNHYSRAIQTLAEHDARHQSDLLKVLETYLDTGRNGQEAARRLYLHRNTLRRRLNTIASLGNLDLDDPLVSLNLHVALKEYKLRQNG